MYISIPYLGIIKLLNLCSIYIFILKSMLFAMLIKTARLQSHYCLYLMVPIAILFNVLIGYGINVHVSKKPEKTEYYRSIVNWIHKCKDVLDQWANSNVTHSLPKNERCLVKIICAIQTKQTKMKAISSNNRTVKNKIIRGYHISFYRIYGVFVV